VGRATRSIQVGQLLGGAGALLLIVSLFLDWFEPGLSAWTVFEALDLVLAAAAVAALTSAVRRSSPSQMRAALVATSTLSLVVVASQLLDGPPTAQDRAIEPGGWLALAGAAVMTAGAMLTVTGISLTVTYARRHVSGESAPSADASPATEPGDRRRAAEPGQGWWEHTE
jgi:hypothetical protein